MVENGAVTRFEGNYSEYAAHQTQQDLQRKQPIDPRADRGDGTRQTTTQHKGPSPDGSVSGREHRERERQQREQQKRLNTLEKEIAKLERQLKDTQAAIETATTEGQIERIAELGNEYVALEQRLLDEYDRWAELAQG
jgi:ATPase subunit of ABC transporter with duplicated ATPase domains